MASIKQFTTTFKNTCLESFCYWCKLGAVTETKVAVCQQIRLAKKKIHIPMSLNGFTKDSYICKLTYPKVNQSYLTNSI